MLSVSFATHILSLIGGSSVCESRRIDGAVKAHYEQRAKVRQRPPLTAQQIRVLELLVKDDSRSPLRSLCQLITQVVSGEFNLDATRSGLFIPRPDDAELEASDLSSLGSEDEDDADDFEEEKKQWKMLQAGGSLMMSKMAALIFVTQARGAFTRPWTRLDRLLHAADVFQSDMRDRLNARSFSTICVVRVLGIIMPDALTYEPKKRKCFMCGSGCAVSFHVMS